MTGQNIKAELFSILSQLDDKLEYKSFDEWVDTLENTIDEFNKSKNQSFNKRAALLEWLDETTPQPSSSRKTGFS